MFGITPRFGDRVEAGRELAAALDLSGVSDPLVMALPRGGVPVAFEIVQRLGLPLDLLIVRKIGAPGQPELGIGAVVDGPKPHVVVDEEATRRFHVPPGYLATEKEHQLAEIERRHRMYFGEDEPRDHDYSGRDVILVDDGIANGGSIRAGIHALRQMGVRSITVAVPVAAAAVLDVLRGEVDQVVCLETPRRFEAVGRHYEDFGETTDQDVVRLLKEARRINRLIH